MMTKKMYGKIASLIKTKTENNPVDELVFFHFIEDLACIFKEDNPNFNKDKFFDACGFGEEL